MTGSFVLISETNAGADVLTEGGTTLAIMGISIARLAGVIAGKLGQDPVLVLPDLNLRLRADKGIVFQSSPHQTAIDHWVNQSQLGTQWDWESDGFPLWLATGGPKGTPAVQTLPTAAPSGYFVAVATSDGDPPNTGVSVVQPATVVLVSACATPDTFPSLLAWNTPPDASPGFTLQMLGARSIQCSVVTPAGNNEHRFACADNTQPHVWMVTFDAIGTGTIYQDGVALGTFDCSTLGPLNFDGGYVHNGLGGGPSNTSPGVFTLPEAFIVGRLLERDELELVAGYMQGRYGL